MWMQVWMQVWVWVWVWIRMWVWVAVRNLNLTLWNAIRECWSSVSDSDFDSESDFICISISICSLGFRSHHPLRLRLIHGLKLRYSNWDFQTLRPAHFMLVDRLSAGASLISHRPSPATELPPISVDLICILNMLISYDGLRSVESAEERDETSVAFDI